jgi:hypothetical protein
MPRQLLYAAQQPPNYCQYVAGACQEAFLSPPTKPCAFFAYSSDPAQIAETISIAADSLRNKEPDWQWTTWNDVNVTGQLIFCEICKHARISSTVIADITTLNFNLMFEIGYAISLGIPTVLIRDTSYARDSDNLASLGLLDTIGYIDFQNSEDLVGVLPEAVANASPLQEMPQRPFRESPVYVLRSAIKTDGSLAVESTLKKSRLRFRTYDPQENIRLTLNDARRQVDGSIAVVANLLDANRKGASVHNALCAFVTGYAVGKGLVVALLQEGSDNTQPVDYRDIVVSYDLASSIPNAVRPTLDRVYDRLQSKSFESREVRDIGILNELDLGDVAAENEIGGLQEYFVPTGQSFSARRGHAPLVVGRKGSGKSALFYEIRNSEGRGVHDLVLDLRPEGHQFTRLREFADEKLSRGMQEFALNGFWTYLLLTEMARKVLEHDSQVARRDPNRFEKYRVLEDLYSHHNPGSRVDFPQRLVYYVERLISTEADSLTSGETIMHSLYSGDTQPLRHAVIDYLRHKDSVWLLIDNLDKSSPVGGAGSTDILLIRSLLDSSRTLRNDLQSASVEFKSLLFLRSDIYERLIDEAADKGKDSAVRLEWNDPEALERIVERRILASTDLQGSFRNDLWPSICAPLVGSQHSFDYIVDRTLMRPRDLLMFLHRCVETAINRGHSRIDEDDVTFAENGYSTDMLRNVQHEMSDLEPTYANLIEAFAGASAVLDREEVRLHLEVMANLESKEDSDAAISTLIQYGFLGVLGGAFKDPTYAFSTNGGLQRLNYALDKDDVSLVIHPAFRSALGAED